MEPQKSGNGQPQGLDQRSKRDRESPKVRSWTVQNETRGVLGRVSSGAAGRALDSANPRETRLCSLQRRRERTQLV